MNGFVVVDASLAFKWLVREERSEQARALSRSWANEGIRTAAPHLMPVEVATPFTGGCHGVNWRLRTRLGFWNTC